MQKNGNFSETKKWTKMKNLTAKTSITIHAAPSEVWKTITTPKRIKEYLMGTDVQTDWKEGSDISYSGEYEGKQYHDKGTIKRIEPEKLFESTYWSSMSGKEDKPENYNTVTYRLSKRQNNTVVTLSQDNIQSEKEKQHAIQNWKMVLKNMKETTENIG
jgi:uncharacterized protein YndB with AHSA1/START domain